MSRPIIPKSTNRAHLLARDPKCDTVAVLNIAMRRLPGRRFADMNLVAGADADWNLHWTDNPAKNHFTHIVDARSRKRRPLNSVERHRAMVLWNTADMKRLRKNVGTKRRPKWTRPFTVAERQRQARRRRVVICWEVKSPQYALPMYAERVVKAVESTGYPAYFMTLVNMRGWGRKLRGIKRAGGQTALLTHGCAKPRDFADFADDVDVLWPNRWGRANARLGAS